MCIPYFKAVVYWPIIFPTHFFLKFFFPCHLQRMMLPIKESFPLWACNLMQIRASDCQMSEVMMPWSGCSWLHSQNSVVVCCGGMSLRYLRKILWKWSVFTLDLSSFACLLPRNIVHCSNDVTFAKEAFKPWCLAFYTPLNVPKASTSRNICSEKAPFLRCKTKRQENKSHVYLLCYNMPLFSFRHCFLTLVVLNVVIIHISGSIFQG